ncbi:hypothetical protein BHU72_02820 [Desulfuribacillus stibiiarsenatis]|uniref:Chemotaxis protein n=1 Tax=Desulfuribacillus stibiiarsenatis TaxID=1390249 RepID=A0A1E5L6H9_9FIRM|nr:methyl-accepting chemotaxis protein [Desulfuribacillus stibiiarsenatis]OEH85731.1 hypothetical protein BHU72_02820 [Desulfuribacillus stibiiarsenatis]
MGGIRGRLLLFFGTLVAIICIGLGVGATIIASMALESEIEKAIPQKAVDASKLITSMIDAQFTFLEGVAKIEVIQDPTIPIEEKILIMQEEHAKSNFSRLLYADTEGKAYASDAYLRTNAVVNVSARNYYHSALSGKRSIMEPTLSVNPDDNGAMIIVYAVPIYHNNQTVGVLIAVGQAAFLNNIAESIHYGKTGYSYIVNKDGVVIAHRNVDFVVNQFNPIEEAKSDVSYNSLAAQFRRMINKENSFGEYKINGVDMYVGFAPVESSDWSVAVTIDRAEVLEAIPVLRNTLIVGSIVALIIGLMAAFLIGRSISAPIKNITETVKIISTGDLTPVVPQDIMNRKDETGEIAVAINNMKDNLKGIVSAMTLNSQQVATSSEELLASAEQTMDATHQAAQSAQEVAEGSERQVISADETAKAMEEMTIGVTKVAESSMNIAESASDMTGRAKEGNLALKQTIIKMDAVKEGTESTAAIIKTLNEQSTKINDIIQIITNIADQTNLLALNAAIEAARAGEAGRGFAVVADEIRKLADQSSSSAGQIKELIHIVQQHTQKAFHSMEQNQNVVSEGTQMIENVEIIFAAIMESIQNVSGQIEEISSVSEQMSAGAEQVSASVHDLAGIARTSADHMQGLAATSEEQLATMEEVTKLSENLLNMADELKHIVEKFRV